MSNPTMISAQCPYCGKEIDVPYYGEINIAEHPEFKSQILSGDFFKYTCPHCNEVIPTAGPLLYHDPNIPAMIYYLPQGFNSSVDELDELLALIQNMEADRASLYQARLVSSIDKLLEKIYIYDAKLDDRIVELVKLAYLKHYGKDLQNKGTVHASLFMPSEDKTDAQIVFILGDAHEMASVDFSKDYYVFFATEFSERLEKDSAFNQFRTVDEKWAINFISEPAAKKGDNNEHTQG